MSGTVTNGPLLSCGYRQVFAFDRFRFEFRHLMTELAAVVTFLLLAMIFFAATTNAVEAAGRDDSLSALRDYVQLIETGAKSARSTDQDLRNVDQNQTADAAYAALRTFADRIGVDEPAPTADLPKLAEADNLLDFLRGLNSPAQPSAAPKGPATRGGPVAGGTTRALPSRRHMSARRFARPAMRIRSSCSTARSWERSARRRRASSIVRIVMAPARRT